MPVSLLRGAAPAGAALALTAMHAAAIGFGLGFLVALQLGPMSLLVAGVSLIGFGGALAYTTAHER
jgi:hypothetical protein